LIEEQLGSARRGGLVAGHKKDVVVSNRLGEREGRVAIYGWHYTSGQPIQPLSIVHGENYLDYSHGVRLVRSTGLLDGTTTVTLTSILKDSALHVLLSDEGPLVHDRYNY
jgi:hypothetical protein